MPIPTQPFAEIPDDTIFCYGKSGNFDSAKNYYAQKAREARHKCVKCLFCGDMIGSFRRKCESCGAPKWRSIDY